MSNLKVVNGRLVKFDVNEVVKQDASVANPERALFFPTNFEDADNVAEVTKGKLPASTQQTIATVVGTDDAATTTDYTEKFGVGNEVKGQELLGQIDTIFTETKTPIGLSNKLIGLNGFDIHIKIDDSPSMEGPRWQNVFQRLNQFINLLQVVPTGTVTFSFLNRPEMITINRSALTPQGFVQQATAALSAEYQNPPNRGHTPIYRNLVQMLEMAYTSGRPTAHYLLTDGDPNDYDSKAEEVELIKELLLKRFNPQANPFTFLCCSDKPEETLWMHEIEEIACRAGAPGFVAALQNFRAEQLEVLNDQGPEFPYTEALWLLCNLTAAMNPNDLDALDQHAPLTKPTLENIFGRELTLVEYEIYFHHHPNATWLFGEDYNLFLTTPVANQIQSVALFDNTLSYELSEDIRKGNDVSEPRAIARAEKVVLSQLNRQRSQIIFDSRWDFWQKHYLSMEAKQLQHTNRFSRLAQQHLWGDYVAARGLDQEWLAHTQQFYANQTPVPAQPVVVNSQLPIDSQQAPLSYTAAVQAPAYYAYQKPGYHTGVHPVSRHTYNQLVAQQSSASSSGSSTYSPAFYPQQQQPVQPPQNEFQPSDQLAAQQSSGYPLGSSSYSPTFYQPPQQQGQLQQNQPQPQQSLPPAPCCTML